MSQTPLERLHAAYKAWHDTRGGSIETWIELLAPEVQFHSLADGAAHAEWTKHRRTPDEVRAYLKGLTAAMKMREFRVDRFVCQGDTIVMIGATSWEHRSDMKRRVDTPKVDVWRFNEAGQAIEFTEYYDTAQLKECLAQPT